MLRARPHARPRQRCPRENKQAGIGTTCRVGDLGPRLRCQVVEPALRKGKIIQNLELLRKELDERLDPPARARVRLMVADLVLPLGAVGLDERTRTGSLIVQHYLTATAAELAPLMWLHAETDDPWFSRYLTQCEACLRTAREWEGTSG
jgi:hypothetical protein